MSVQKINQPHQIGVGDYYQYIGEPPEDDERNAWEPGDLVLVLKVADDGITYQYFNSTTRMPVDDFYESFEFDPDGEAKRERQMQAVVKSLNEPLPEFDALNLSLNSAQLLLSSGSVELPSNENPVTALAANRDSLTSAKMELMSKKISIDLIRDSMKERANALDRLLSEKKALLDARVGQMKDLIAKMEYIIQMVNLYLGEDVEVFTLRSGEPAPATEMIAARQLVLYCDEECMVAADDGGIDFKNYEEFDKWLLKRKKNLDQVLPEKRGIIALQLRREAKHYSDNLFENALLNKENRQTYLLIRNGENLYRIIVPIAFGKFFFPKKGEFEELFQAEEWYRHSDPGSFGDYQRVRKPIRPGTFEYESAMEKADARQRYYLRNVLLIQGIIDRTQVFAPLAVERPNILNPEDASQIMRFIHDAENTLSDGRLSFKDWLYSVNEQTRRGCRVMGAFGGYNTRYVDYESRLHPKGAKRPAWNELHVIDRIEDDQFVFLYDRKGEIVYSAWYAESHEAKNRASMRLRPHDDFWINFDAVTPEDIRFYLDDRLSRRDYISMAPLLRRVMALKIEEREYEKPFRLLIQGELLKENLTVGDDQVADLINWWKFKTCDHRAIAADDAKAVRMIVGEAKARQKRESLATRSDALAEQALPVFKNAGALFVYRSGSKEFQVGYPANDKNVFFHRVTWVADSNGGLIEKDRKEWFTVNLAAASWNDHCLYQSLRWEKWESVPRRSEILSDPELDTIRGAMTAAFEAAKLRKRSHYDETCKAMAIGVFGSDVTMYFIKESKIEHNSHYPHYQYITTKWKRTRQGLELEQPLGWFSSETAGFAYKNTERVWFDLSFPGFLDENEQMLWFDVAVFAEFEKKHQQAVAAEKARKEHEKRMKALTDPLSDIIAEAIWAGRKQKFLQEGGQEGQWEAYKKKKYSLSQARSYPHRTCRAVLALLENDLPVIGQTVKQVWKAAKKLGVINEFNDSDRDYYKNIRNYVFVEPKTEEDENE